MVSFRGRKDVHLVLSGVRAVPLLLLAALACSSPVGPRSGVTLLVTNGTCIAGSCTPLEILGFPSYGPLTPGGPWSVDLGLLTAPSVCLTFPSSATFRVIAVSSDGTKADTTVYRWTPADALSLGTKPAGGSFLSAVANTSPFVPATAAGWGATLPNGSEAFPRQTCSS